MPEPIPDREKQSSYSKPVSAELREIAEVYAGEPEVQAELLMRLMSAYFELTRPIKFIEYQVLHKGETSVTMKTDTPVTHYYTPGDLDISSTDPKDHQIVVPEDNLFFRHFYNESDHIRSVRVAQGEIIIAETDKPIEIVVSFSECSVIIAQNNNKLAVVHVSYSYTKSTEVAIAFLQEQGFDVGQIKVLAAVGETIEEKNRSKGENLHPNKRKLSSPGDYERYGILPENIVPLHFGNDTREIEDTSAAVVCISTVPGLPYISLKRYPGTVSHEELNAGQAEESAEYSIIAE